MKPQEFISVMSGVRFLKDNEKKVQAEIEKLFPEATREYYLTPADKIDFIFLESGLGVEVKIKGQQSSIIRQLERYADSPLIVDLLLVTGKSVMLPRELKGKKLFKFNINQAWL